MWKHLWGPAIGGATQNVNCVSRSCVLISCPDGFSGAALAGVTRIGAFRSSLPFTSLRIRTLEHLPCHAGAHLTLARGSGGLRELCFFRGDQASRPRLSPSRAPAPWREPAATARDGPRCVFPVAFSRRLGSAFHREFSCGRLRLLPTWPMGPPLAACSEDSTAGLLAPFSVSADTEVLGYVSQYAKRGLGPTHFHVS